MGIVTVFLVFRNFDIVVPLFYEFLKFCVLLKGFKKFANVKLSFLPKNNSKTTRNLINSEF